LKQVWAQIPGLPRAQSLCAFLGAADATAQGTSYSTTGATADPHDPNANIGIPAHSSEEQWRIRMIRAATSEVSPHQPEEQLRIRMIQTPALGISAHPFNASDDTTSDAWIFDTACTHHMVHNHELFHDYNQFPKPIAVCGIGSGEHLAYGQGTLHIASLHNGHASNKHHLEYVWYVPEMDINIISKAWMKRCGLKVKLDDDEGILITNDKGMCLKTQDIAGHSYITNLFVQPFLSSHATVHAVVVASEPQSMAQLWHRRLSHTSTKILRMLGYNGFDTAQCPACIQAKQVRKPFRANPERATSRLFCMYSDLCGPVNPLTHDGMQYVLTFMDEATRFCWIYLLHDKSSSTVVAVLQSWLPFMQNQASSTLKRLCTDRG
jgi:Pol polyprotein, beta-barrel domain/GAG-pre-integrase domain